MQTWGPGFVHNRLAMGMFQGEAGKEREGSAGKERRGQEFRHTAISNQFLSRSQTNGFTSLDGSKV